MGSGIRGAGGQEAVLNEGNRGTELPIPNTPALPTPSFPADSCF